MAADKSKVGVTSQKAKAADGNLVENKIDNDTFTQKVKHIVIIVLTHCKYLRTQLGARMLTTSSWNFGVATQPKADQGTLGPQW